MNIKSVSIFFIGVVLAVVTTLYIFPGRSLSSSLSTDKPKKQDKYDVNFKVDGNPATLEITDLDCANNSRRGCFKVKKSHSGFIKFIFDDPNDEWQLTEFKVCKATDKNNQDCKLDLWERLDFFVANDSSGSKIFTTNSNGIIDLKALDKGSVEFYLLDQNVIKKEYFYSIKACKDVPEPAPDICVSTDPLIDNKGRN